MEKETYAQLELFSQLGNNRVEKRQRLPSALLAFLHSYEKIMFLIIAFILTAIISFSLGVEKGKKITASKSAPRFDVASQRAPQNQQAQAGKYSSQKPVAREIPKEKAATGERSLIAQAQQRQKALGSYTIQLASYQNKALAEKEAQALRKRGFAPSVLSKGKYIVLYVGNFSNKKTAEGLVLELKKRYQGCLVRRL